jgi:drug/metabolite transporter (DMT)-like permease
MQSSSRALFQIHFCVFLWGFTAILGKAITLSALPLVWWRMLIVTGALMLMPKFWRGFAKTSRRAGAIYLAIGLVVATHWVTFYASIKLSNASVAATCMAFTSFFIAFFEPLLMRRAFDVRELFFGLAVIPGVALVVGGTPTGMRTGLAVGALSAFLAAIFGILNKRFIEHGEPLTVTGLEMAAGTGCLTIIGLIHPSSSIFVLPGHIDAAFLVILAIGCTLAPFALSLVALRRLTAFTTALALNMEPVYAIVLAIAIFGEQQQLKAGFYAGVAIVLAVVFSHPLLLAAGSGTAEASHVAGHPDL